jgi:hypothetical protein
VVYQGHGIDERHQTGRGERRLDRGDVVVCDAVGIDNELLCEPQDLALELAEQWGGGPRRQKCDLLLRQALSMATS